MDIFKEFLESSTIHGLYYISASKSRFTKFLWALVVIIGFITCGYLINDSFTDWHNSPVSSEISTHPITELDFPKITVCPPKGFNTALNYDLMRADNSSLTTQDRNQLKEAAREIFILQPHSDYADIMLAATNPDNLRTAYEGYQIFQQ